MVEQFGTLENYTTNYSTTSLSAICHLVYYFDAVVIFLLSFMAGSSLPPVLVDSNQRHSSGIILYFIQVLSTNIEATKTRSNTSIA